MVFYSLVYNVNGSKVLTRLKFSENVSKKFTRLKFSESHDIKTNIKTIKKK